MAQCSIEQLLSSLSRRLARRRRKKRMILSQISSFVCNKSFFLFSNISRSINSLLRRTANVRVKVNRSIRSSSLHFSVCPFIHLHMTSVRFQFILNTNTPSKVNKTPLSLSLFLLIYSKKQLTDRSSLLPRDTLS